MHVIINGKNHEIKENETLTELVELLQLSGKFVAVERNKKLVPRTKFAETLLNEGDILEIVTLVGGG